MSVAIKLSTRDKLKIQRLYAKGLKPAEICAELPSLKLTPRQVTNFLFKRGWTKRRTEIEATKQQTAAEIMQRVRQEGLDDFEATLTAISSGIRIDAEELADGWKWVRDAGGISALMRAKTLHLDRAFRFHGVEKPEAEQSGSVNVMFIGSGNLTRTAQKQVQDLSQTGEVPK